MSDVRTYAMERAFNAPRELVWKAWTDPDLLPRWFGPNVETIVHRLELKPGGLWLVEMRWSGKSHFQRVEYTEITPPERLVWLQSASDAEWEIKTSSRMPDWPRVLLTTVVFEEDGSGTRLRLTCAPHQASEAEIACFAGAMGGADRGWAASMDELEDLLDELQA